MLCSWCDRLAVWWVDSDATPPSCKAHDHLSIEVDGARIQMARPWYRRQPPGTLVGSHTLACFADVVLRDSRELRGLAIDWSRPVEGWTLFGEAGSRTIFEAGR